MKKTVLLHVRRRVKFTDVLFVHCLFTLLALMSIFEIFLFKTLEITIAASFVVVAGFVIMETCLRKYFHDNANWLFTQRGIRKIFRGGGVIHIDWKDIKKIDRPHESWLTISTRYKKMNIPRASVYNEKLYHYICTFQKTINH